MPIRHLSIKDSILTKLFRVVFAIYFIVTLVVTFIQMWNEYNHTRKDILGELQRVKTSWEPGLATIAWNFDLKALESSLQGLISFPVITGVTIEIQDNRGQIIGYREVGLTEGNVFINKEIKTSKMAQLYPDSGLKYEFDIIYSELNERVGKGTLYSSREIVLDRVKYGFVLILVNAVIKTAALWVIFLVVGRIILGKPLAQLIDLTQQINLDNLEQLKVDFNQKGYNELTIFAETLQKMIDKLLKARETLREYTKTLEKNNEELHQLDQLKDDFLARTSHELYTPLHGIIGIAQSLLEHPNESLSMNVRSNLNVLISSGQHLTALVNDILDFSKMKHQNLHLNIKAVDLRQVVEIVIQLSQPLLAGKSITLTNSIPLELPRVLADENRLQQICYNLIGNALKFTEHGGVEVLASVEGQYLEIIVADTGIGIANEHIDSIFDSYKQGDDSISRKYEGMGLGLTITKQLVELHQGNITVRSIEGVGTRFILQLPLAPSEAEPLPPPLEEVLLPPKADTTVQEVSETSEGFFTILAIDDDTTNLQIIANFLVSENYRVACVSSGQEALDWFQKQGKPDLILLDIMMPQLNGFEICQILRKDYAVGDLPIIFLTASHRRTDLETGFALGANDYLTKPFEKAELLARIHAHLLVLLARYQLMALRDYANRISEFKDHVQMLQLALAELKKTCQASEIFLLKDGQPGLHANTKFPFLNQKLSASQLNALGLADPTGVSVRNDLSKQDPLYEFYQRPSEVDFAGSHWAFLRPTAFNEYTLCLFREPHFHPFNELERQYMLSLLEQFRVLEKNIRTMLSDKLIRVLPEIQPYLDRITHISASAPYCNVYYENQRNPKLLRIAISSLDLYFPDDCLLKVHKSHLINPNRIFSIRKLLVDKHYQYEILLKTSNNFVSLRVGETFIPRLQQVYPQYFQNV